MTDETNCRNCGALLTADARDGVCPKCLLGQALASESGEESADAAPSSPVITEGPGTIIGRYKLLEKIGEGGFGVVYMAEQEEPVRRRVALKIIKPGMDTREVIARFEAERQALALMDHPNIAKVFDGGATDTGRPYFVMELVRGVRITDYCVDHHLSTRDRLDLFMQVCHAIQHAHQKGIIHRDLKPSNILVTRPQPGAPGTPKVIDFGIAKATSGLRLTDKTLFTRFLQFLGTPAYMSPEQLELTSLEVDTRSDIYSLGVLLYELLTGHPPFETNQLLEAGWEEMRRVIREVEPPKPSTRLTQELAASDVRRRGSQSANRNPHAAIDSADSWRQLQDLIRLVRGDLDWIVMKCLEKDRDRRYETANGLAADLQRHLEQQPIVACPPSQLYRFQKFVRRNQTTVAAAGAVVVALVLGVIGSTWQWRKAVLAQQGEAVQRRVAETNAAAKRAQLVRLDVANGERALETDDWFRALLWFTEALRQDIPGTRAEILHRYRIGAVLQYVPRLTRIWFHAGSIHHVAFSPDGQWALTASADGTARLWNVSSGLPGAVFPHGANVQQAAFSADGQRVLTVGQDGSVKLWNSANGQMVCPPLTHGYPVTFALFSRDGRRVFAAGEPPLANRPDPAATQPAEAVAGELRIWDATTGRQVRPAFHQAERFGDLVLSGDGQWLAASLGWSVMVWNVRDPQALHLEIGTEARMTVLPSSEANPPDPPPELRLPDIPPRPQSRASAYWPSVNRLAFSPDSRRLLTGHNDSSARIWSLPNGASVELQIPRVRGRQHGIKGVHSARFTPDGLRVILADTEGVVRFWDARTGEAQGQLDGKAWAESFSPDGRLAFLSGQVWDLEANEAVPPRGLQFWLSAFAFSPDGVSYLTAGRDGSARLWNMAGVIPPSPPFSHDWSVVSAPATETEERRPAGSNQEARQVVLSLDPDVSHAAFSSDGRRVVTASRNGSARVWDAATGQAITPFVFLEASVEVADFNREGTRFVTAGGSPLGPEQGLARIWDAQTGQPLSPVILYRQRFESAHFDPDGRWLVTQTREGVQIWNVQSGEPAELPLKLGGPIRTLAFSPEGSSVAVCTLFRARQGEEADSEGRGQRAEGGEQRAEGGGNHGLLTSAATRGAYQTRLWNLRTGQPVTAPLAITNEVRHVEFSPDGRWVLTMAKREPDQVEVQLWDVATGQSVAAPVQEVDSSPEVIFTLDGRHCIVIRLGVKPVVWELPAGRVLEPAEWRALNLYPWAVTRDGQRVATVKERELRVLDAVTGDPLTPMLPLDPSDFSPRLIFSPDGSQLLTLTGDHAQLWSLPMESRPVEELVLLAQLLSGCQIDDSGNYAEWSSTAAVQAWQELQPAHPVHFSIPAAQVQSWHERVVTLAEAEKRWFTVAYHLEQLVKAHPDDPKLRRRLAEARDNAALEELR